MIRSILEVKSQMNREGIVLLFKMPAGRDTYASKLLEILSAPIGNIIMLTTYNKRWVPDEVFNRYEDLIGKKAWFVCVDADVKETNVKKEFNVKRFIPLRQVEITHIDRIADQFNLYIKVEGYLKFDSNSIDLFNDELVRKIKKENLPPNEKVTFKKISI